MAEYEFSPADQVTINPFSSRWGRPIASGTYDAVVVGHKTNVIKTGDRQGEKYPQLEIEIDLDNEAKLPEGPVKVGYNAIPKSYQFTNMLSVFAPEMVKVSGKVDHAWLDSLVGRPVRVVIENMKEVKNPDGTVKWKAKASIGKLLPDVAKKCQIPTKFKSEVDPFDAD